MSDWLNIELEAREGAALLREYEAEPVDVKGRCAHGFTPGLCWKRSCPHEDKARAGEGDS